MVNAEGGLKRTWILLSLILAGEMIFFLPFVLARIFRHTLLDVFQMTNLELGTCFSVYGIVAMLAYFFGGPLADRFSARSLMTWALVGTSIGGGVLYFIPGKEVMMLLYGYWGMTTIFLFWAALIRATREWGGETRQGKAFGLLEGGRGLVAALIGAIALFLFSIFIGDMASLGEEQKEAFQVVVGVSAVITLLSGVLVWINVPSGRLKAQKDTSKVTLSAIRKLIKKPAIWMQAIIIICGYVGYKITDDFSLYARQVLKFDEVAAAGVGSAALWLRPVFAVLAGVLADKFRGIKIIVGCFAVMILGGMMMVTGWLESTTLLVLLSLTTVMLGVYGIRGIYFAIMQDSGVPVHATGTAVGIMSFVGFTPDVFMSPLMGYLLDEYPGAEGHRLVFGVLVLFGILGLMTSFALWKKSR